MPKQLLYDIELWMSGKIQSLEDIPKQDMKLTRNKFKCGAISIESVGFLQERLLEIIKYRKFVVCRTDAGNYKIINTNDINKINEVTDQILTFSSWSEYFHVRVPFDNRLKKYKIEWFDDRESAELFIEVGGFDNE